MHFCHRPIMPHGIFDKCLCLCAASFNTLYFIVQHTRTLPGQISRRHKTKEYEPWKFCSFFSCLKSGLCIFSVWYLKNEDDDSYNEQNPQIRVVTIVQRFTINVPIWRKHKTCGYCAVFLVVWCQNWIWVVNILQFFLSNVKIKNELWKLCSFSCLKSELGFPFFAAATAPLKPEITACENFFTAQ